MQSPDFWNDHEQAGKKAKELTTLKEEVLFWEKLEQQIATYLTLRDEELATVESDIFQLKHDFEKKYISIFLSGVYDHNNAILAIHAGAGGVDAQDWAAMLLRMYQKYCERIHFSFTVIDQSFGEQTGTKHVSVEVIGRNAYGLLRREAGVHRLVRISPFSAKSLRHTSFALVDVLPIIKNTSMKIAPQDLRVDTFRSSGPGGQNVNKLETAVRITHLPTNISIAVQSERSQAQNKEKAMAFLESRLTQLMQEQHAKTLSELRANLEDSAIAWGNQIRSYVLNPYKLVKDNRTGIESPQPERVLEGELEPFIEAEVIGTPLSHDQISQR